MVQVADISSLPMLVGDESLEPLAKQENRIWFGICICISSVYMGRERLTPTDEF